MSSASVVATENRKFDSGLNWVVRVLAVVGALLVVAIMRLSGEAIVHGHPTYWIVLAVTFLVAVAVAIRSFLPRKKNSTLRRLGRSLLVVLGISWLAIVGWLLPSSATSSGLQSMLSTDTVSVVEGTNEIDLVPTGTVKPTGVLFQPGAKVDARAYAKTLMPLARAGHVVVIAKQPLGVGFLAMNALDSARATFPDVSQWVVGGHSLGGTVAALDAATETSGGASNGIAPVVGLLLYASYPAGDMSAVNIPVLSISGSNDGLSTPAAIQASKANLPSSTTFLEIPGAIHSYFGDYGPQFGDGVASTSRPEAFSQISTATVEFVNGLD